MTKVNHIWIRGAKENNLKNLSLSIPKNKFILVTGVSGSGKSSLVHDIIAVEGQRRYLEQLNPKLRSILAKMQQPDVDEIEGLSPVISLDQISVSHSIRSTVGTLSGIYDNLRLLYARYGERPSDFHGSVNRSMFSFNLKDGACPTCSGLGESEFIDPDTFILYPDRSIRDGAFSLTTANGYIIYSQVTIDVLEEVCQAEGFSLSIPWNQMSTHQQHVILRGSDKIQIPFGKHPLSSRMKWTGITPKPREYGYYRGILNIMEEILRRDRNKNILKYVNSAVCPSCSGSRLNSVASAFKYRAKGIAQLNSMSIKELIQFCKDTLLNHKLSQGEQIILKDILLRSETINSLGLSYLRSNRESASLSGGEVKRIRLSTLLQPVLSNLIFTLDEPTVGLHPVDHKNLLAMLETIQKEGNTIVCIDHKFFGFSKADYWIDLGPGAGIDGGEIIFSGQPADAPKAAKTLRNSITWKYAHGDLRLQIPVLQHSGKKEWIRIVEAESNNLKHISPRILQGGFTVICGVSGAGKSSLLNRVIYDWFHKGKVKAGVKDLVFDAPVKQVIKVDQSPIGRTPRSNPATYTKVFDLIRDLFASLPVSKELKYDKSRFSFNVSGGRCESCGGAGRILLGVSYLGQVEVPCDACQGKRFHQDSLAVKYKGHSISDVLGLDVVAAINLFSEEPRILVYLNLLKELGLGYLKLGQSSTTLSGGEAQRIKLATQMLRAGKSKVLFLLDEPTNGLHFADIQVLLNTFSRLIAEGHTLIVIEHEPQLINLADWIVELGPGAGDDGGHLIFEGTPVEMMHCHESVMASFVRQDDRVSTNFKEEKPSALNRINEFIELENVVVNNLKGVDIRIPYHAITAITGASGSGKTSLLYDTLLEEAKHQYSKVFSSYVRQLMGGNSGVNKARIRGLQPAVEIKSGKRQAHRYSTVATLTGIYTPMRLLFARFSINSQGERSTLWSSHFSFLHPEGACQNCHGTGIVKRCNQDALIKYPEKPVLHGGLDGSRTARFYANPNGQHFAMMMEVASRSNIPIELSWEKLDQKHRDIILYGTGDQEYQVEWNFKTKQGEGRHQFNGKWLGLYNLVNQEYERKAETTRQQTMEDVMVETTCLLCQGSRIHTERRHYQLLGLPISGWLHMNGAEYLNFIRTPDLISLRIYSESEQQFISQVLGRITNSIELLIQMELGYLSFSRWSGTLSSGEFQRVKLAGQFLAGLNNMMYLIDEPSSSLHPKNISGLNKVFRNLVQKGNSVIFTDHHHDLVSNADYQIELGPEGGKQGGQVMYQGSPQLKKLKIDLQGNLKARSDFNPAYRPILLENIQFRNLKIERLALPKGWISLCGVSGAGKSSLLNGVIRPWLIRHPIEGMTDYTSDHFFNELKYHHTPLELTGIDNLLIAEFKSQNLKEAKKLKPGFFNLGKKGGRCETCKGKGFETISLDYLGMSKSTCIACDGTGYDHLINQFEFIGETMPVFLNRDLTDLCKAFPNHPIIQKISILIDALGIGYLSANQHGNTLSSGEKQRLALIRMLSAKSKGPNYILIDEPSRGMHARNSWGLGAVFKELAKLGSLIITIDHDPIMISQADWVIELGPSGGDAGGRILFEGTPEMMLDHPRTNTSVSVVSLFENQ